MLQTYSRCTLTRLWCERFARPASSSFQEELNWGISILNKQHKQQVNHFSAMHIFNRLRMEGYTVNSHLADACIQSTFINCKIPLNQPV